MPVAVFFPIALVLGFVLPGYLLARLLAAGNRWLWSFPLSLVLLFWAVLLCGTCGLDVTGTHVVLILLGQIVVLVGLNRICRPELLDRDPPAELDRSAKVSNTIIVVGLCLVTALTILRTSLWPLSGNDNPFRWDFLAQCILREHNFSFYPPMTPADYRIYFYTDAIPPMVSFSYWWLYATSGGWHPALTSILVGAQLATILWFVYFAGRKAHSAFAGALSAGVLAGSTLFVHNVAIGQETGLTALSVAAMFCAILYRRDRRAMILAGFAAALGALSREYGCAIAILGSIAVIWMGGGFSNAVILSGVAAIVAGPWYLRNWLHTGNPLYSNRFGPFHVNTMHVAILDYYCHQLGVGTWKLSEWLEVAWSLVRQAPLQFTVGIAAAVILFRKTGFLGLTGVVFVVLWLDSIGYTSANWPYAMRVLTPALVGFSVPAGMLLARLRRPWIATTIVGVPLTWSLVAASLHPYRATEATLLYWRDIAFSVHRPGPDWWTDLPKLLPPGARVLCDNAYISAGLTGSGIDFVPVWSPEVSFILDAKLTPLEIRQELLRNRIEYSIVEYTLNGVFLTRHVRFYRDDIHSWKTFASAATTSIVFKFPSLVRPTTGTSEKP